MLAINGDERTVATGSRRQRALLHAGGEEGQAAVELAMCLPVLLVVVMGILTFGIAINNYLTLTNATSVGARQLAISRAQTTDPCATVAQAIYSSAPTLHKADISFTFLLNGAGYSGPSCKSASTSTGAAANLVAGAPAQVLVTYPCTLKVMGVDYAPNCTLQTKLTELVQ
jgi:Flp pilus assembly protein TadG